MEITLLICFRNKNNLKSLNIPKSECSVNEQKMNDVGKGSEISTPSWSPKFPVLSVLSRFSNPQISKLKILCECAVEMMIVYLTVGIKKIKTVSMHS